MSTPPEPRSRQQSRSPSGRFRQRGAVAVLTAVSLLMLIPVLALAINIGQLYYAQRDLEKQATLAALSAVQISSGCVGGTGLPATMAAITAEVTSVIAANSVDGANSVQGLLTGINGSPAIELGRIESSTGLRIFVPLTAGNAAISAVRVNLSRPQPVPFINLYGGGGMLYASATAQQAAVGSFSIGTGLLSLNGGLVNGLLGGLLCAPGDVPCQNSITSLNVANSFTGLVNTSVSLGQLGVAVGLSVADLSNPVVLGTHTPLLSNVLDGLVGALSGTANSAVIATLQGLANAASNPNEVPLGQLLGTVNGLGGDAPIINLFDLLIALGQATVADGGVTPISLPINLSVPGIANISTFLKVLEPPQLGIGRAGQAEAKTAQVRLQVRIEGGSLINILRTTLNTVLGPVFFLLGGTVNVLPEGLNLGIDAIVAGGTATLAQLQCPRSGINGGKPIAKIDASTATARIEAGTFSGSADAAPALSERASLPVVFLRLLGGGLDVGLGFTTIGVGAEPARSLAPITDFTAIGIVTPGIPLIYRADGVPPAAAVTANPQTISAPTTVSLNLNLTSKPSGSGLGALLTGLLSGILNAVLGVLNPLLSFVNGLTTSLIDPLLSLLGIKVGTATVTMNSVQIGQPILVNTCLPGTVNCQ